MTTRTLQEKGIDKNVKEKTVSNARTMDPSSGNNYLNLFCNYFAVICDCASGITVIERRQSSGCNQELRLLEFRVWIIRDNLTVRDKIYFTQDERLAPLLPVLVGGVRILTRQHAVEPHLKQRLSLLLHRIATLYGLPSH